MCNNPYNKTSTRNSAEMDLKECNKIQLCNINTKLSHFEMIRVPLSK